SQRLSHERGRIADLVKEGENILVLFGGVAPFAIVIAKKHRNVKVYSIEINPDAHMYALENVRLNKVEDRVFPVQGDVIEVLSDKKFENWADRIIMPLPWNAINFIPNIIHSARKGSMLHIYTFCRTEEVDDVKQKISNLIGRPSKLIYCRRVRTYSPDIEQYVFDFLVNG
ncbi:MAG: class I SAM-dependent methyltransferase family protein, partial [Candidatus Micrarchaeia archaeon]